MKLPSFDRARAEELLKERSDTPLTSSAIASKAHRRWDLDQHAEAAVLFCVACERASEDVAGGRAPVDQSPNYFVRAAINFNLAGLPDIAEPMLREATQIDWNARGLGNDSHMTEWAFVELLLNRKGGPPDAFVQLFEEATARCSALGWRFPRIHPKQEVLLAASLELGLDEVTRILIENISNRRPISRATREVLRRASEQWESQQPDGGIIPE